VSLLESRPSEEEVAAVEAQPGLQKLARVLLRTQASKPEPGQEPPNWLALRHWTAMALVPKPLTSLQEPEQPSAEFHCWPVGVVSCNHRQAGDLPGRRKETRLTPG